MEELLKQLKQKDAYIESLKKKFKDTCDQYDSTERKHNNRITELQDELRLLKKRVPKVRMASYKNLEKRLAKSYECYLKNNDEKSKIEIDIILFCLGYKTIEQFMEAKNYTWE